MGQLTIVVDKMLRTLHVDTDKEELTASHCRNEFLQLKILLFLLIFYIHIHQLYNKVEIPFLVYTFLSKSYSIGGVMVSVLASSTVDRGFEPRSGQTKDYKLGICCFSAKHAALMRKSKDWLVRNQNNVSEWGDMPTPGLLFQ